MTITFFFRSNGSKQWTHQSPLKVKIALTLYPISQLPAYHSIIPVISTSICEADEFSGLIKKYIYVSIMLFIDVVITTYGR